MVINILLRLPLCLETEKEREEKGERHDKRVHTKRQRESAEDILLEGFCANSVNVAR